MLDTDSALKFIAPGLPVVDRLNRFVSAKVVEHEAAREKLVMTARPVTARLVAEVCVGQLPGTTTSG